MAIKRQRTVNPLVILDAVIVEVERDVAPEFVDGKRTGEMIDRGGRLLTLQTASLYPDRVPELLVVKVPDDPFEGVEFDAGVRALMNVEYLEWSMREGASSRNGSTMRFAGFVAPNQLDQWLGLVGLPQVAAA